MKMEIQDTCSCLTLIQDWLKPPHSSDRASQCGSAHCDLTHGLAWIGKCNQYHKPEHFTHFVVSILPSFYLPSGKTSLCFHVIQITESNVQYEVIA